MLTARAAAAVAAAGVHHTALGLDGSKFTSSHSLLSLHMWLIIRRLAEEGTPPPKDAKVSMQYAMKHAEYSSSYPRLQRSISLPRQHQ
jgi:hypothetical protein